VIINKEATGEENPEKLGPGVEEPDMVGNHEVADGEIDEVQTAVGWRWTRELLKHYRFMQRRTYTIACR
jgi:hypothetical protein